MENEKVEDRICNYSGLLSVEQYQWIDNNETEWTDDEWEVLGHS